MGLLLTVVGSILPCAAQTGDYNPEFPADPGSTPTLLSYTVSVGVNDAKMGYVSGAGTYKYGRNIQISTSAKTGYVFKYWLRGSEVYSTNYSFWYVVDDNVTFTAVYEEIPEESDDDTPPPFDPTYDPEFPAEPTTPVFPDDPGDDPEDVTKYHKLVLIPSPEGSCTFSIPSGQEIAEDGAYSVTVTPGMDMVFQGWYKDGIKISDDLTYATYMGNTDVVLTARFEYVPLFPDDPESILPNVLKGDINGDGEINVTDVVELTNHILRGTAPQLDPNVADMNDDGEINITDVVALTNYCLSH